jgi:uncharacterized membrane protein
MLGTYLLALSLTLAVEGSLAYLLGLRKRQFLLAVAMINVSTFLPLNYLLLVLGYLGISVTLTLVILLEILVVVVEWRLLLYVVGHSSGRLFAISLLGNAASFLMGVLLFGTFGQ